MDKNLPDLLIVLFLMLFANLFEANLVPFYSLFHHFCALVHLCISLNTFENTYEKDLFHSGPFADLFYI